MLERYGPTHQRVGAALHNVGIANLRAGKLNDAHEAILEAVRIRKLTLGSESPKVAVRVWNSHFIIHNTDTRPQFALTCFLKGFLGRVWDYLTLSQRIHWFSKSVWRGFGDARIRSKWGFGSRWWKRKQIESGQGVEQHWLRQLWTRKIFYCQRGFPGCNRHTEGCFGFCLFVPCQRTDIETGVPDYGEHNVQPRVHQFEGREIPWGHWHTESILEDPKNAPWPRKQVGDEHARQSRIRSHKQQGVRQGPQGER